MRFCLPFIEMFKYELCSKYSASWKASARNLQSYSFPDYNTQLALCGHGQGWQALKAVWTSHAFPLTHPNHLATRVQTQRVSPPSDRDGVQTVATHPSRTALPPLPRSLKFETTSSNPRSSVPSEMFVPVLSTYAGCISFASLGRAGRKKVISFQAC